MVVVPDSHVSLAEQQPWHVVGVHFFAGVHDWDERTPTTKAMMKAGRRTEDSRLRDEWCR